MLIRKKKKYLKNCKSIQRETPEKVQQKLIICLLTLFILCLGLEYLLLINEIYELRQNIVEVLLKENENLVQEIADLKKDNSDLHTLIIRDKKLYKDLALCELPDFYFVGFFVFVLFLSASNCP